MSGTTIIAQTVTSLKSVHNKGADETVRKHRLVCAFDVWKPTTCKSGFLSNKK